MHAYNLTTLLRYVYSRSEKIFHYETVYIFLLNDTMIYVYPKALAVSKLIVISYTITLAYSLHTEADHLFS